MSSCAVFPKKLSCLRRSLWIQVPGWITVPFFPLFCLFVMDYMNYQANLALVQNFWTKHPGSARFEAIVVLFLFSILTLLLRRIWLSAGVFGLLSCICAYVNYTKAALNGDNFYPQDLAMVTQSKGLTSFISGSVPRYFVVGIAAILIWVTFFWFIRIALPRFFFWRWSLAALMVVSLFPNICTTTKSEMLLNRFGMSTNDSALQSSNYTANGFLGAFTVNLLSMQITPPAGYSQTAVQELLAPYASVPAASGAEVFDVILVLSESFFDARTLPGVTFSENPLTNYDRLLTDEHCFSGMLYTTAMGGGTVRPEFGILTGLTTDYLPNVTTPYWYVTRSFPNYISNYKAAGYKTIALHPYDPKFYSRESAYPLIGFDEFYSEADMYERTPVMVSRGYVSDYSTTQVMMDLVDAQTQPTFLFTITMQNHQPYNPLPPEDIHIQVDCSALTELSYSALTTYVQGLHDADQMLGTLTNWIDQRERPTALVFFGDHLPTLGPNFLAYDETGFVDTSDGTEGEERQRLYSTPFLIYSNRELELGMFSSRTGNTISDYNLLNALAMSTGMSRTPYMELLADFYETIPYYNVRLTIPETPEIAPFTRAMKLITYDRVLGHLWSK